MTAPQVRANRDAHTVDVTIPPDALASLLVHIAAEIRPMYDLFDELHTAAELAEHAHPDTLTMLDTTRDAAFNRRDQALAAVLAELPPLVWSVSTDVAATLAEDIARQDRRARGDEQCSGCLTWIRAVAAQPHPAYPERLLCHPCWMQVDADTHEGVRW